MSELTPSQRKDEKIIDKNIADEEEAIESYQDAKEELSTEKGRARAAEIQDDEREHKEELEELKIGKSFREMFDARRSAVYDKVLGIEHFEKRDITNKNNVANSTPSRAVADSPKANNKNLASEKEKEIKEQGRRLNNNYREAKEGIPWGSTERTEDDIEKLEAEIDHLDVQILAAMDKHIDFINKAIQEGHMPDQQQLDAMKKELDDLRMKQRVTEQAMKNLKENNERYKHAEGKLEEFNNEQAEREAKKAPGYHEARRKELEQAIKDVEDTIKIMSIWTDPKTMGPVMLKDRIKLDELLLSLRGELDQEIGHAAKEEHMKKYMSAEGILELNREAMPHRTRFPPKRIIDMFKGKYGDLLGEMKKKGYSDADLLQEWDELDPNRENANSMSDYLDPRNRNKPTYDKKTGKKKEQDNKGLTFGLTAKESGGFPERRHYPLHRLVKVTAKKGEDGQIHYYVDYIEKRRMGSRWGEKYKKDEHDFLMMDENGNPYIDRDEQGVTTKPTTDKEIEYQPRDGSAKPMLGSAEAKQKRYLTKRLKLTEDGQIALDENGQPIIADPDDENAKQFFTTDNFTPGDSRTYKIHHKHEIPKKNVEFIKDKKTGKIKAMYYREAVGKDAKGKTIWAPVLNGWRYYSMSNVGKDFLKLTRYFPNHNNNVNKVIRWMEEINATAEKLREAGYDDVVSPFEDMSYLDMSDAAQEAVIFKEVFGQDIDIMGVKLPKTVKINTNCTLDEEKLRLARIERSTKYTYAVIQSLCDKNPKILSPSQIRVFGQPEWENGELKPPQIYITGIDNPNLQRRLTREFYRLFEGTAYDSARTAYGYEDFEKRLQKYESITGDTADSLSDYHDELTLMDKEYKSKLKAAVAEKQDAFWNKVCEENGLDKDHLDRRWGGLRDQDGNPVTVLVTRTYPDGSIEDIPVTLNEARDVDAVNLYLKTEAQEQFDTDKHLQSELRERAQYLQYLFNQTYRDEILENYMDEVYAELIYRYGLSHRMSEDVLDEKFMSLPEDEREDIIKAARTQVTKKYPFVQEAAFGSAYRMWQNWPDEKKNEELEWFRGALQERDERARQAVLDEEKRREAYEAKLMADEEKYRAEHADEIAAAEERAQEKLLQQRYNLHARMGREYAEKLGINLTDSEEDTKKAVELFERIAVKRGDWEETLKRIDEETAEDTDRYKELDANRSKALMAMRAPEQFDPQRRTLFHLYRQAKGDPEHLKGLSAAAADDVIADARNILNNMFKTFLKPAFIQQLYDTYKEAGLRYPDALKNLSEKAEMLEAVYDTALYHHDDMYEALDTFAPAVSYTDGYTVFQQKENFNVLKAAFSAMQDIIIGAQDRINGTDDLERMFADLAEINRLNPEKRGELDPQNRRAQAWADLDEEMQAIIPEEKEKPVDERTIDVYVPPDGTSTAEELDIPLEQRDQNRRAAARAKRVEEPEVEEKPKEEEIPKGASGSVKDVKDSHINAEEIRDLNDLNRQLSGTGNNSQNKTDKGSETNITPVGEKKKDTAGDAKDKQAQKQADLQKKLERKNKNMPLNVETTSKKASARAWNGSMVYVDESILTTSFRKMMHTRSFKKDFAPANDEHHTQMGAFDSKALEMRYNRYRTLHKVYGYSEEDALAAAGLTKTEAEKYAALEKEEKAAADKKKAINTRVKSELGPENLDENYKRYRTLIQSGRSPEEAMSITNLTYEDIKRHDDIMARISRIKDGDVNNRWGALRLNDIEEYAEKIKSGEIQATPFQKKFTEMLETWHDMDYPTYKEYIDWVSNLPEDPVRSKELFYGSPIQFFAQKYGLNKEGRPLSYYDIRSVAEMVAFRSVLGGSTVATKQDGYEMGSKPLMVGNTKEILGRNYSVDGRPMSGEELWAKFGVKDAKTVDDFITSMISQINSIPRGHMRSQGWNATAYINSLLDDMLAYKRESGTSLSMPTPGYDPINAYLTVINESEGVPQDTKDIAGTILKSPVMKRITRLTKLNRANTILDNVAEDERQYGGKINSWGRHKNELEEAFELIDEDADDPSAEMPNENADRIHSTTQSIPLMGGDFVPDPTPVEDGRNIFDAVKQHYWVPLYEGMKARENEKRGPIVTDEMKAQAQKTEEHRNEIREKVKANNKEYEEDYLLGLNPAGEKADKELSDRAINRRKVLEREPTRTYEAIKEIHEPKAVRRKL